MKIKRIKLTKEIPEVTTIRTTREDKLEREEQEGLPSTTMTRHIFVRRQDKDKTGAKGLPEETIGTLMRKIGDRLLDESLMGSVLLYFIEKEIS